MNELTADVNLVVIVRRDRQGHRPDKTIFKISRGRAVNLVRPDFDVARLSGFQIEDFDDAANAAGAGCARPDDVVVDRIGSGPTALTAGDSDPGAARNATAETSTSTAAAGAGATRAAIRWAVLPVAVDV